MGAAITGIGTAFPEPMRQDLLWDGFFREHFGTSRAAERVFSLAGVRNRHAVANPLSEDLSGWSTAQRMQRYATEALPLAKEAVSAALADAGLGADDIGLLTVASCTGYATPGLDIRLAADLGMAVDLQRLFVGHMGCYAAIPALGTAADYVVARERPAVLLCLELTSLHVQPATGEIQQVIAHSLFGDAAAAVVLRPEVRGDHYGLRVRDVAALTDVATADHITWEITDLGFRMGLSPRLPEALAQHVAGMLSGLLAKHGLEVPDISSWAIHPGGPRILDTVQDELALSDDALAASRTVLAECGNCSSATVLLVLDMLRAGGLRPGEHAVAMSFGPGLTLYATLLHVGGRPPWSSLEGAEYYEE